MSEDKPIERNKTEKKKPFGEFNKKMEEVNENIKSGFQQISNGFATMFGVKKDLVNQTELGEPESVKFEVEEASKPEKQEVGLASSFQNAWDRFVSDANENFEKMKAQSKALIEKNNENFKKNVDQIDGFFKERRQEFDQKLHEMQEEMKRKENERKEAWKQRTEKVNEDFQMFLKNQEKDFKRGVRRFNRLGWSLQWRCIIWLIPVFIVIFVILYVLVFFQGLVPFA